MHRHLKVSYHKKTAQICLKKRDGKTKQSPERREMDGSSQAGPSNLATLLRQLEYGRMTGGVWKKDRIPAEWAGKFCKIEREGCVKQRWEARKVVLTPDPRGGKRRKGGATNWTRILRHPPRKIHRSGTKGKSNLTAAARSRHSATSMAAGGLGSTPGTKIWS